MALEHYRIEKIEYDIAMDLVIKNHYLHRKAPCSSAWGLFLQDNIMGVIVYGTPASSALRCGLEGKENSFNVIELTRLWVDDSVPKNGESYLIGRTLPMCGKELVVSYAEISQGHVGTVYQATNWIYTGLSAKRTNWVVSGLDKHTHTLADKYTANEIREKYGDRFSLEPRPRKHRYVYINAKGKRKKQLLLSLKYDILPYPKRESF